MDETQPATPLPKARIVLDTVRKSVIEVVTIVAEIAVVAVIGAYVGSYLSFKTITHDCATVNLAKVGDNYVNCTVVVPKKDTELQPPR